MLTEMTEIKATRGSTRVAAYLQHLQEKHQMRFSKVADGGTVQKSQPMKVAPTESTKKARPSSPVTQRPEVKISPAVARRARSMGEQRWPQSTYTSAAQAKSPRRLSESAAYPVRSPPQPAALKLRRSCGTDTTYVSSSSSSCGSESRRQDDLAREESSANNPFREARNEPKEDRSPRGHLSNDMNHRNLPDFSTALVVREDRSQHRDYARHLTRSHSLDSLTDDFFRRDVLTQDVSHSEDTEECDSLAELDALIAETSMRWQTSASNITTELALVSPRPPAVNRPAPIYSRQSSYGLSVSPDEIIAQQQAEIEALRAQLAQQHLQPPPLRTGSASMEGSSPSAPVEQIDVIPLEQIEVIHHRSPTADNDELTVWSGLTNMMDQSYKMHDGEMSFQAPNRRPDADSVTGIARVESMQESWSKNQVHPLLRESTQRRNPTQRRGHNRVRSMNVELSAANGVVRKAVYSGTVNEIGQPDGTGVLKFVETGDMYTGEVMDGEMHGQGVYTFAKNKRKKAPYQVLRGRFEHNVFTGWDPDLPEPNIES